MNNPRLAKFCNHCLFISSVGTLTRIDLPGFLVKNLEIASKAVFVFRIVILKAFYPLVLMFLNLHKFGVHFHPFWMSNTLGGIIFIHPLRSTLLINLS